MMSPMISELLITARNVLEIQKYYPLVMLQCFLFDVATASLSKHTTL